jgi:preprotein translocase subunit YajC
MDVAVWSEMVQTLGLPIVLIGALCWFIFKLWKQSAEREKTLYTEIEKSHEVNEKAIATIAQYAEKLGDIQEDVRAIKHDITLITANMDYEK